MTKKKTARKQPAPAPVAPVTEAPNFGLGYTQLSGGHVVIGVRGPSFTVFRNKRDAADWLRNLARAIEDSSPSY